MYSYVDGKDKNVVEGFAYQSKTGMSEGVRLDGNSVDLIYTEDKEWLQSVYVEDIPKLIKALQAAYDHKKGVA